MNKATNQSRKNVTYLRNYQKFESVDVETGKFEPGVFMVTDKLTAKTIQQDRYSIVILNDGKNGKEGSKGIAMCMEGDEYSMKTGLKIAFYRAMIKHFEKLISELAHPRR